MFSEPGHEGHCFILTGVEKGLLVGEHSVLSMEKVNNKNREFKSLLTMHLLKELEINIVHLFQK